MDEKTKEKRKEYNKKYREKKKLLEKEKVEVKQEGKKEKLIKKVDYLDKKVDIDDSIDDDDQVIEIDEDYIDKIVQERMSHFLECNQEKPKVKNKKFITMEKKSKITEMIKYVASQSVNYVLAVTAPIAIKLAFNLVTSKLSKPTVQSLPTQPSTEAPRERSNIMFTQPYAYGF